MVKVEVGLCILYREIHLVTPFGAQHQQEGAFHICCLGLMALHVVKGK